QNIARKNVRISVGMATVGAYRCPRRTMAAEGIHGDSYANYRFPRIPTKQKRRSTGPGAKKPLDPQRPEKSMGPRWRQQPRTLAPQASVMVTGVRDDVGYEYTCFMRGGEDACLHGRFSGTPGLKAEEPADADPTAHEVEGLHDLLRCRPGLL